MDIFYKPKQIQFILGAFLDHRCQKPLLGRIAFIDEDEGFIGYGVNDESVVLVDDRIVAIENTIVVC